MLMHPMIIVAAAVIVVGATGLVMYAIASKHDKDGPIHH